MGHKYEPPWSRFGKRCHFGGWSRFLIMFRKKMAPPLKWYCFFRQNYLHLWRWHQNSARGGAELRTMERLQDWSCFGSTFFQCTLLNCCWAMSPECTISHKITSAFMMKGKMSCNAITLRSGYLSIESLLKLITGNCKISCDNIKILLLNR